jgi:hypothetical protein
MPVAYDIQLASGGSIDKSVVNLTVTTNPPRIKI